ncbi:hypothetical protein SAMN05444396_10179 [Flavobacterium segetis]|uniref:Uncharacterized protein n=1 Tax=Flavobacterium segetis TaxID=271157 RepID=A0A1M5DZY2_9FLAO|nr:hypothetical protein SAMN05444396_10179 [Flavobacterium segetis]
MFKNELKFMIKKTLNNSLIKMKNLEFCVLTPYKTRII